MDNSREVPPDLGAPSVWSELVEAVGPGSILVIIESRMSAVLRKQVAAEDILQEALLYAWRDRAQCEWRGLRSFRSWLLTIVDNRIRAAADYAGALKRGGERTTVSLATPSPGGTASDGTPAVDPWFSTTPSRLAAHRDQATAMIEALAGLPPELAPAVRMRIIEQLPIEEIASRLEIGVATVRHRVRKGSEIYRRRLRTLLSSRALSSPGESESK